MNSTIDFRHQPSRWERYDGEYAGLPVAPVPWPEESGPPPEAGSVAWRFEMNDWDDEDDAPDEGGPDEDDEGNEKVDAAFGWFFEHVDTTKVTAIVVGEWESCYDTDPQDIIDQLVENADKLPALRSLFFGAITPDECMITWIQQGDITELLEAFPKLERLEARGGTDLFMQPVRHESLRTFRIETGALSDRVVRAVADSDLPALELLELWFGAATYGGNATAADLAPIMSGDRLPSLRHLRLQNGEFQDDIAAALATAPIVARLESLSLSMGSLTDTGAESLLTGQPLTHLRRLDLSRSYLSDAMMTRLTDALPDVELILSDQDKAEGDWRYVAVSE
ncbi:STM4015 family protein [Nonomuraea purpurea]|uniref:STM4015 family protein n=1 Tax=Nonomuraea purpurea TaxID=1849276 RepID=A0ABV8GGX5_9ACTN